MPRVFPTIPRPLQLLGFAVALLLLAASDVLAQTTGTFPRGPGFYYSPYKLVVAILSFWGWAKLCVWLDKDAIAYRMNPPKWNGLMVGGGVLGLLLLWNLHLFWIGIVVFWMIVFAVGYAYAHYRNLKSEPDDRLLTQKHLVSLANYYFRLGWKLREDIGKGAGVPVKFLTRSANNPAKEDTDRLSRVRESRGYKGALQMVYEAAQRRATDIHLEPTSAEMAVRFRVDGIMMNATPFSRTMGDAVVNIFKVICNLDITEKRKPQDGSFSAQVEDRVVEFRVATAGSVSGEKMVMRLLDAATQLVDLTQIGMTDNMRETIHGLVTQPHGMLLVCGPTGSGKSTTLYACLHEIDRFQLNVITIENPVEFRLENITQIEVNPKAGKTFASELRSILRQDPDVIMVGEIRDKETAEIACQAAQTGHMVFSTVHANDTVTAIARLIDLGVQPFMVASALTAVLGQRLVRRLCPECKQRYKPAAESLKKLDIDPELARHLYRTPDPKDPKDDDEADVCEQCGGAGYFKRVGIFELLIINDRIRDLMRENPNLQEIRREAVANGLKTLLEDGARMVVEGDTSIQELLRVSK